MKKYNLYLHSKDKTNTKNNNATFDINWNFLPDNYQLFNLDISFQLTGQCADDYADVNHTETLFNFIFFGVIKISSSIQDINSYDTSSNSNSYTLGYAYKSENYADFTTSKGISFTTYQIPTKTIYRPSNSTISFLINNYSSLVRKDNLYNKLINYVYNDRDRSNVFATDCAPWTMILTFTPVED